MTVWFVCALIIMLTLCIYYTNGWVLAAILIAALLGFLA